MGKIRTYLFILLPMLVVSCAGHQALNQTSEEPPNTATFTPSDTQTNTPFIPTITFTPRPTRTPTLTSTITPTPTPYLTPTSPPIPPLIPHEWKPETFLIQFGRWGGDGADCCKPDLILLGNGSLYRLQYSAELDRTAVYEAKLPQQKVCQLLNTIDQTGFFQYDSDVIDYSRFGDGGGAEYMYVDAWTEQHFHIPGSVEGWLMSNPEDSEYYFPPILPAISDTHQLLETYRPSNLEQSENQITTFFVGEAEDPYDVIQWPETFFPLAEFFDGSECDNVAVGTLVGEEGFTLQDLAPRGYGYFREADRVFFVNVEQSFPFEFYSACVEHHWPQPTLVVPDMPNGFYCEPADGTRTIP